MYFCDIVTVYLEHSIKNYIIKFLIFILLTSQEASFMKLKLKDPWSAITHGIAVLLAAGKPPAAQSGSHDDLYYDRRKLYACMPDRAS